MTVLEVFAIVVIAIIAGAWWLVKTAPMMPDEPGADEIDDAGAESVRAALNAEEGYTTRRVRAGSWDESYTSNTPKGE